MNKDTVKIRKQILEEFLYNLYIISNKSYQKRVWIETKGPEVHSFDNAVCDFFDLGEYIFDNYKGYNITKSQQKLLNEFRKKFENFVDGNRPYLPKEFIDTPEWQQIMNLAKDVLDAFDYQKT
jgi:hypothetical protein